MRSAIVTLLFCCILLECKSQCSTEHPDYDALIAFYESASGENWKNNRGWTEGVNGISCDPCNFNGSAWFGIGCFENRVIHLELFDNNLIGSIDSGLSHLEFLEVLELAHNQLTGALDDDIFKIESLYRIDLSNNDLNGIIPTSIGNLKELRYVDLSNNNFSGCFSNTHFNLCPIGPLEETGISGYSFSENPKMAFLGNFGRICGGAPQRGAPCNDGDTNTIEDTFYEDCSCIGVPSVYCDNLEKRIGESCDDNNDNTINDIVLESCQCIGVTFSMYVPNIVSKHSQNGNDIIAVFLSIIPRTFDFQIFNRWGGVVYSTKNHLDQLNIKTLRDDLPSGVYIYRCEIDDSFVKVGSITIVN